MFFKKIIFIAFVVVLCGAHEIKTDRIFQESLEPDRMQLSFWLTAKAKSAKEVKEILHPAIAELKKFPACKGGGYTLGPEYNYKSGNRDLLGFRGSTHFECRFKDIDEMDGIVAFFDAQKKLELQQSPIIWVVDDENIRSTKMSLELKSIQYAKEYIELLGKENIAKCRTKNIEILTNSHVRYEAQGVMTAKSSM